MKPNKFQNLRYRVVKIDETENTRQTYIISAHEYLSAALYDYKLVKTLPGTFDIEHCVGYDENGLGVWEQYKGGSSDVQ